MTNAAGRQRGVTVVARRRVRAGHEERYEALVGALTEAAHDLPGYLGAEIHRPAGASREYVSVIRFDGVGNLEAFERSGRRRRFLADVAPHVEGDAAWERMTGLELWFEPPPGTVVPQPSPVRMAIVLVAVVYLLVLTLTLLLSPLMTSWPLAVRLLVVVVIQVTLMTFVIMPRVTRWLARWIYPSTSTVT